MRSLHSGWVLSELCIFNISVLSTLQQLSQRGLLGNVAASPWPRIHGEASYTLLSFLLLFSFFPKATPFPLVIWAVNSKLCFPSSAGLPYSEFYLLMMKLRNCPQPGDMGLTSFSLGSQRHYWSAYCSVPENNIVICLSSFTLCCKNEPGTSYPNLVRNRSSSLCTFEIYKIKRNIKK